MNKKSILSGDYVAGFVDGEGCFDLQFRRDVRHERVNKPIYYSWKVQFAIVARKDDKELLKKIKATLNCGYIYYARGDQVRYSVQDIENLCNVIIPFFKKYPLFGKKKKDFELWAEAVTIIYQNKNKPIVTRDKKELQRLIEIHRLMQKYKSKRPQGFKWASVAESITTNPKFHSGRRLKE